MIRRISALAVLLFALAFAACARPSADPARSAPSVASSPDPPGPDLPSAEGGQTLSGTVTAGVEPGCVVLKADDRSGSHLLVFDDEALRSSAEAGARVTVVGKAQPGMVTTCQ